MGFGVLFCGYLITYLLSLNPYAALTRLIGYGVMFVGLSKLARHNRWFGHSRLTVLPLGVLALVDTVLDLLVRFSSFAQTPVTEALQGVMTLFVLLLHVCLMLAIHTIAADTELPKLGRSARMGLGLTVAYAVLNGLWALPVDLGESYALTLSAMLFLLQLIWTLFNLVLIFRCYMWICLEGDEEMEQKPSRFAFINRMREKRAARNQKAYDEAVAYAEEKRRRRAAALGAAATKPKHRKKKKKK